MYRYLTFPSPTLNFSRFFNSLQFSLPENEDQPVDRLALSHNRHVKDKTLFPQAHCSLPLESELPIVEEGASVHEVDPLLELRLLEGPQRSVVQVPVNDQQMRHFVGND